MSTPQDDPIPGRNDGQPDQRGTGGRPTPGASGPDPIGRTGLPGEGTGPAQQPQYGYRGMPPSGYAYPTSGLDAGPVEKGPAPREVVTASYLILAAGILYLLSSILSALTTQVPGITGAALGVGFAVVFGAIGAGIYVLLAVFIRRGQNWARITATVLAALNVALSLASLAFLPLASDFAEAGGQQVTGTSPLVTILGLVVMLLGAAGVVMTYLKPARPYFAPQRLGY